VTSPPPLPPRRVHFSEPAGPVQVAGAETASDRPADLPDPAEAPSRGERYLGWTLLADAVALVPLLYWIERPNDAYLAVPALLLGPAVHAAHGEPRNAGISLAMRAAMLGGVYLAGRGLENQCRSSTDYVCVSGLTLLLADVALVSTMVAVDSVLLARRQRPASEWYRLPMLSASLDHDGRRLLTLTARF
jgi:hypothetical protein